MSIETFVESLKLCNLFLNYAGVNNDSLDRKGFKDTLDCIDVSLYKLDFCIKICKKCFELCRIFNVVCKEIVNLILKLLDFSKKFVKAYVCLCNVTVKKRVTNKNNCCVLNGLIECGVALLICFLNSFKEVSVSLRSGMNGHTVTNLKERINLNHTLELVAAHEVISKSLMIILCKESIHGICALFSTGKLVIIKYTEEILCDSYKTVKRNIDNVRCCRSCILDSKINCYRKILGITNGVIRSIHSYCHGLSHKKRLKLSSGCAIFYSLCIIFIKLSNSRFVVFNILKSDLVQCYSECVTNVFAKRVIVCGNVSFANGSTGKSINNSPVSILKLVELLANELYFINFSIVESVGEFLIRNVKLGEYFFLDLCDLSVCFLVKSIDCFCYLSVDLCNLGIKLFVNCVDLLENILGSSVELLVSNGVCLLNSLGNLSVDCSNCCLKLCIDSFNLCINCSLELSLSLVKLLKNFIILSVKSLNSSLVLCLNSCDLLFNLSLNLACCGLKLCLESSELCLSLCLKSGILSLNLCLNSSELSLCLSGYELDLCLDDSDLGLNLCLKSINLSLCLCLESCDLSLSLCLKSLNCCCNLSLSLSLCCLESCLESCDLSLDSCLSIVCCVNKLCLESCDSALDLCLCRLILCIYVSLNLLNCCCKSRLSLCDFNLVFCKYLSDSCIKVCKNLCNLSLELCLGIACSAKKSCLKLCNLSICCCGKLSNLSLRSCLKSCDVAANLVCDFFNGVSVYTRESNCKLGLNLINNNLTVKVSCVCDFLNSGVKICLNLSDLSLDNYLSLTCCSLELLGKNCKLSLSLCLKSCNLSISLIMSLRNFFLKSGLNCKECCLYSLISKLKVCRICGNICVKCIEHNVHEIAYFYRLVKSINSNLHSICGIHKTNKNDLNIRVKLNNAVNNTYIVNKEASYGIGNKACDIFHILQTIIFKVFRKICHKLCH